jgi:hypothetical protein
MADVFLSYSSDDRTRAQRIAAALESRGWSVWWDRKIIAGDEFDRTIERELDAARCVVVLWSHAAILSEWVKTEAAAAADQGLLVPCMIDAVKLPLEFRRRQTADLTSWDGDVEHPGWQTLADGIAAKVSGKDAVTPPSSREPVPKRQKRTAIWMGAVGLSVLLVVGIIVKHDSDGTSEPLAAIDSVDAEPTDAGATEPTTQEPTTESGSSAQTQSTPEASTNYPLTCLGGGPFAVEQDAEKHVRIGFGAAAGPAREGLNPGECSWSDRSLSENENAMLCDDTEGAGDLTSALAEQDNTVTLYVHYDPQAECLRVVRIGG